MGTNPTKRRKERNERIMQAIILVCVLGSLIALVIVFVTRITN